MERGSFECGANEPNYYPQPAVTTICELNALLPTIRESRNNNGKRGHVCGFCSAPAPLLTPEQRDPGPCRGRYSHNPADRDSLFSIKYTPSFNSGYYSPSPPTLYAFLSSRLEGGKNRMSSQKQFSQVGCSEHRVLS